MLIMFMPMPVLMLCCTGGGEGGRGTLMSLYQVCM